MSSTSSRMVTSSAGMMSATASSGMVPAWDGCAAMMSGSALNGCSSNALLFCHHVCEKFHCFFRVSPRSLERSAPQIFMLLFESFNFFTGRGRSWCGCRPWVWTGTWRWSRGRSRASCICRCGCGAGSWHRMPWQRMPRQWCRMGAKAGEYRSILFSGVGKMTISLLLSHKGCIIIQAIGPARYILVSISTSVLWGGYIYLMLL